MLFLPPSWIRLLFLTWVSWQALGAPSTQLPHQGARILEAEGLFEGDILLPEGLQEDVTSGKMADTVTGTDFCRFPSENRAVVPEMAKLWPKGVLPYVIDTRPAGEIKVIREAMTSIEAASCLRFVERTEKDHDYVFIHKGADCSSHIGRQGGMQRLSIGNTCVYKAVIIHELLHAAGFFHEHTRSDRDNYLRIFPENVKEGLMHNFKKLETSDNRLLTPFDTKSVMLYGSEAFSRAPGLVTILTKDGTRLPPTYKKEGLSTSDALRIRMLYNCVEKPS